MKFGWEKIIGAAALLLASLTYSNAQNVVELPVYVGNASVVDFGNGPIEFRGVQGNANLFTAQSSGVGSTAGSSTALTLTGIPATPPCVGCAISGTGITAGTTVAAFNGTTGVTLSAAMNVAGGTAVSWGAACPATAMGQRLMPFQAGTELPIYTYARVCGLASTAPGATVLPFPIGSN